MDLRTIFHVDPCFVLKQQWLTFSAVFVLMSLICAAVLVAIAQITKSQFRGNFAFGCLSPIVFALVVAYLIRQEFGFNPGYCGFTPDNIFLPVLSFFVIAPVAIVVFFGALWFLRRHP